MAIALQVTCFLDQAIKSGVSHSALFMRNQGSSGNAVRVDMPPRGVLRSREGTLQVGTSIYQRTMITYSLSSRFSSMYYADLAESEQ